MRDYEYLRDLSKGLSEAPRLEIGGTGEGSRFIQLSDELAVAIAERLLKIASALQDEPI